MSLIKIDLSTLERYILDSLEKTKGDAPSLGGFSCAVIELLGRFLRIHQISRKSNGRDHYPHKEWFYDFIENYLKNENQKYFKHRYLLWKNLRCESAHCILAQSAITFGNTEFYKKHHLEGHCDPRINRKSLLIYTSGFAKDLKNVVSTFFANTKKDPVLESKCQDAFREIYNEGQSIINKELKKGNIKIEVSANINTG